ncbi:MAG TPA: glycogen-binding domain-containing protein, partial [Gemmatimonadales bacterium]|nr:glycogen-binding domain-containing protein [Gemmatimonadales bacterium]
LGWRVGQAEPARSGSLADIPLSVASSRYNWWSAEGTYWVSDRVGLTGTVGNQPPNPSLYVSGGQFMRLSVRVALDRRGERPAVETATTAAGLRLRRSGGAVEFALAAPIASRVELMGDFTDWQPVELTRGADGLWRSRLPVAPGVHYLNVRYDGLAWQPPPGTRVVRDDFGKESGAILVE